LKVRLTHAEMYVKTHWVAKKVKQSHLYCARRNSLSFATTAA
jgi:hypothetical protein